MNTIKINKMNKSWEIIKPLKKELNITNNKKYKLGIIDRNTWLKEKDRINNITKTIIYG
tara:strand:+ start:88 stop:264 length:177 start_codon:yes stop_codon:yes gene_type:complete